ncbi:MAG: hypothetical protein MJY67_02950 [Bacteroidales bacterium]|nr:hypothetical protein [Bacteroidales bacterium]
MGTYNIIKVEMNLEDIKNAELEYEEGTDVDLDRALEIYECYIDDYYYDGVKREEKEFPDFKNHPSITVKQTTLTDGNEVHIFQFFFDKDLNW